MNKKIVNTLQKHFKEKKLDNANAMCFTFLCPPLCHLADLICRPSRCYGKIEGGRERLLLPGEWRLAPSLRLTLKQFLRPKQGWGQMWAGVEPSWRRSPIADEKLIGMVCPHFCVHYTSVRSPCIQLTEEGHALLRLFQAHFRITSFLLAFFAAFFPSSCLSFLSIYLFMIKAGRALSVVECTTLEKAHFIVLFLPLAFLIHECLLCYCLLYIWEQLWNWQTTPEGPIVSGTVVIQTQSVSGQFRTIWAFRTMERSPLNHRTETWK